MNKVHLLRTALQYSSMYNMICIFPLFYHLFKVCLLSLILHYFTLFCRKKFTSRRYQSKEELVADLQLMFNNCLLYNEPDSKIGREASRLMKVMKKASESF